jgi:hypothetical protein
MNMTTGDLITHYNAEQVRRADRFANWLMIVLAVLLAVFH